MNKWEKTLGRFRTLGGVADNVVLGEGVYGRGLFPNNAKQAIRLFVPNHLLLPADSLQLDQQGNLVLSDDSDWGDEIKSFYLDYQCDYGFSGNLKQEIIRQQTQRYALPDALKAMLIGFGMKDYIFQNPTVQSCLDLFKMSRGIILKSGKLVLMPLVELVNHDELSKKGFIVEPCVGVAGKFSGEILVNYGMSGDAAQMYQAYGFTTPKPYAFSGAMNINVGAKVVKIARLPDLYANNAGKNVPRILEHGNEIHLSCLVVGSVNDSSAPKKVFIKLMSHVGMPAHIADKLFDGIYEQNRVFFQHFLEELTPLEGAVADGLRTMARNQLIPLGVRI